MHHNSLTGKIILNRYLVGSCIGYGSFGDVYLTYDTQSEHIYALKSQSQKTKNPQLASQARIIRQLSGEKGFVGFQYYGYESKFNVVVMGLLGPSLEDLFNVCGRCFGMKTILMLAGQVLGRLEVLHSRGYVYRDLKPENLLMGLDQVSHVVHLVDFGLSKRYKDRKNNQHISYKENRSMIGTVRYCSINTHLGIQYSRRDDLESLGYMLQYFYKGCLPWQGINANSTLQKYSKILQLKQSIPIQQQFMDMPVQFCTYMHYVRSLKFADRPDYVFLRKLFTDLMKKLDYQYDYLFDWCLMQHSAKLETDTMCLAIRNKYCDLQNPYVTMMSADIDRLQEEEIKLGVNQDSVRQCGREGEGQEWRESGMDMRNSMRNSMGNSMGNSLRNSVKKQTEQDQNQGNVDSMILEDSDLKLISHRNKWFDNQL